MKLIGFLILFLNSFLLPSFLYSHEGNALGKYFVESYDRLIYAMNGSPKIEEQILMMVRVNPALFDPSLVESSAHVEKLLSEIARIAANTKMDVFEKEAFSTFEARLSRLSEFELKSFIHKIRDLTLSRRFARIFEYVMDHLEFNHQRDLTIGLTNFVENPNQLRLQERLRNLMELLSRTKVDAFFRVHEKLDIDLGRATDELRKLAGEIAYLEGSVDEVLIRGELASTSLVKTVIGLLNHTPEAKYIDKSRLVSGIDSMLQKKLLDSLRGHEFSQSQLTHEVHRLVRNMSVKDFELAMVRMNYFVKQEPRLTRGSYLIDTFRSWRYPSGLGRFAGRVVPFALGAFYLRQFIDRGDYRRTEILE